MRRDGRRRTALRVGGAVAVGGAVSAVGGAALARRRWRHADDPTGGNPLLLPLGVERLVPTGDGADLAVLDMGAADQPPIILAHGWTGDRRIWAAVARRLLAAGRHVVVYDQRGHGASTVGTAGLTIEALADDLRAVLEAVDGHDAVLAGHSMGGMTVQMLAVRHADVLAERVGALVLISTAAARVSYSDAFTRVSARLMASAGLQQVMALDWVGPWLVRSSHGRGISLTALDATRVSWLATAPEVRAGFLPAMAALDLTAELASIRVPTVVVTGSRDTLLPPSRSRDIARLIPGARLEVLAGAGHQLPFETPDRLAEILGEAIGPLR